MPVALQGTERYLASARHRSSSAWGRRAHLFLSVRDGQDAFARRLLVARAGSLRSVSRDIEEHAPKPGFEVALAAEATTTTKRERERILNHIKRLVGVAEQRRHDADEGAEARPIKRLDLRSLRAITHCSYERARLALSFSVGRLKLEFVFHGRNGVRCDRIAYGGRTGHSLTRTRL